MERGRCKASSNNNHRKTRKLDTLKELLNNLKELFRDGYELDVVWAPRENGGLAGEVRSGKIYIYENDPLKAEEILTHEFIDYLIAKAVRPYLEVVNTIIKLVNRQAHQEKEKIVDRLVTVILPLVKPGKKRDDSQ